MLLGLLALHAACGVSALAGNRRLGRRALLLGGLAPLATVVWAVSAAAGIVDGRAVTAHADWVPSLGLGIDLRVDAFALLMIALVSGIGTLVFAYAWWYFGESVKAGRAAGLLPLFAGAMLGVVLADNLLLLYVCWELTSITSYLLIGIDDAEAEARGAALHALLVTGMGGLVMLGGLVLLGQEAGTYRLSALLADPPSGTTVSVALVLVLIGAFTKSAQYPFHSWLPSAMVAPTPISAYLHSAAMVKAGVYLVARLAPAFADMGVWRPLVVVVGLVTMIAGGLRALRPFDLKQLLAFGTISQLGFMVVLFGIGRPEATAAGCALLLAHGLFKAALFMVVGIVDHETRTRDVRRLPTLGPGWGPTKVVALVSAASMAAVPPLAGFIAKETAYDALLHGTSGDRLVLAGIVAGSILTVGYSLRFAAALVRPDDLVASDTAALVRPDGLVAPDAAALVRPDGLVAPDAAALVRPDDLVAPDADAHAAAAAGVGARAAASTSPSASFLAPAAVLVTGTVVLGLAPMLWSPLIDAAAHALDPAAEAHLELWHGFTPALLLSMLTLAAGAALFAGRRVVAAAQERTAPPWTAEAAYHRTVRGMVDAAADVTAVVQSGSLPIYAAIVLLTAALVPVAGLLDGAWWPGWPDLVSNPAHVPIASLLIGAALAATMATRRFAAALLLGVVGYGMALLFVTQGAPDLALTQFAVETLSVVVFLLVLRRLPDRFERRPPALGRALRLGVSTAVGVFVLVMAIATTGARTEPSVSSAMSEQALPEGDGKNVVNVILVDIRGLDTVGEVTVLVVAAIGIVALARSGRVRPAAEPARAIEGEGADR